MNGPRSGLKLDVQAMAFVNVCEMFTSIQGESSYAGFTCFFVRLAGCNLRCRYCDTARSYAGGRDVDVPEVIERRRASGAAIAEITGGEPLLQTGFAELAAALRQAAAGPVLVETNGSRDISVVPAGVTTIMDVKCPASGTCERMDLANLDRLRDGDEVKFVLCDRSDYEWARAFVARHNLTAKGRHVFFTAAAGRLPPRSVAEWILEDRLSVRLQVPLHRAVGVD